MAQGDERRQERRIAELESEVQSLKAKVGALESDANLTKILSGQERIEIQLSAISILLENVTGKGLTEEETNKLLERTGPILDRLKAVAKP